MAALRHAARRLCERSLQRAQASPPVAAQEQRRLFLQGSSRGRRLMSDSTVTGKAQTTVGPRELDELRMEYEEMKQELFDLSLEMRSKGAFRTMSWADFQNLRLTTHLAAQVKPKPDDIYWRRYRRYRTYYDWQSAYFCLGFVCLSFLGGGGGQKKDKANTEATILSNTVPANE